MSDTVPGYTHDTYSGTLLCEDRLKKVHGEYNDLVLQYTITETTDSLTQHLVSTVISLQGLARGAVFDHDFGVMFSGLPSLVHTKVIRETFRPEHDTVTTIQHLTRDCVRSAAIKIPLIQRTKRFLLPTKGQFCNTTHGTPTAQAAHTRTCVVFPGGGVNRVVLGNEGFPYVFYLDVYDRTHRSLKWTFNSSLRISTFNDRRLRAVASIPKIIVLPDVLDYRWSMGTQPLFRHNPHFHRHLKAPQDPRFLNWARVHGGNTTYPGNVVKTTAQPFLRLFATAKCPSSANVLLLPLPREGVWTSSVASNVLEQHFLNAGEDLLDWEELVEGVVSSDSDTASSGLSNLENLLRLLADYEQAFHVTRGQAYGATAETMYAVRNSEVTATAELPNATVLAQVQGSAATLELLSVEERVSYMVCTVATSSPAAPVEVSTRVTSLGSALVGRTNSLHDGLLATAFHENSLYKIRFYEWDESASEWSSAYDEIQPGLTETAGTVSLWRDEQSGVTVAEGYPYTHDPKDGPESDTNTNRGYVRLWSWDGVNSQWEKVGEFFGEADPELDSEGNPRADGDRLGQRKSFSLHKGHLAFARWHVTGNFETTVYSYDPVAQDPWTQKGPAITWTDMEMVDFPGFYMSLYQHEVSGEWRIAIGVPGYDLNPTTGEDLAAWTYQRDEDGNWVSLADRYGPNYGQIRVYRYVEGSPGAWEQMEFEVPATYVSGLTTVHGEKAHQRFSLVALHNDRLAAGTARYGPNYQFWDIQNDGTGELQQANEPHENLVKVFEWESNSNLWKQMGSTIATTDPMDTFCTDLALHGDTLAVSAVATGRVFLYKWNNVEWEATATINNGSSGFGNSISLWDTRLAVSNNKNPNHWKGETLVFDLS